MHSSKWNTDYVRWQGGAFKAITVEKLLAIPSKVVIVQGGLSFAAPSAQTHAGIGAGDISVRGMTKDEVWKLCTELWEVDIIPCPRGFVADSFQGKSIANIADGNEHIHFLDRDSYNSMHPQAQAQVREVMAGGDGLLGNAHYTGPSRSHRRDWNKSNKWYLAAKKKKELELPTTKEVTTDIFNRDGLIKNVFTGNPKNEYVAFSTAIETLGKRSLAAEAREVALQKELDEIKALVVAIGASVGVTPVVNPTAGPAPSAPTA